jgi:hypothetical protein
VFTAKDRKEWCGSKRKKNKKKRVHGFTGITTIMLLQTPMKEHTSRSKKKKV